MSKKIFAALIVAVVATFAGYNIYQSQRAEMTMSNIVLANAEALAGTETTYTCCLALWGTCHDEVKAPEVTCTITSN